MTIAAVERNPDVQGIEDVQSYADTRQIPIKRVAVKDINHPVRLKDRCGRDQHSIANFNMTVSLPHDDSADALIERDKEAEHERRDSFDMKLQVARLLADFERSAVKP